MKLKTLEKFCNVGMFLGLGLMAAALFTAPKEYQGKIALGAEIFSIIFATERFGYCRFKKRKMSYDELKRNGYSDDELIRNGYITELPSEQYDFNGSE